MNKILALLVASAFAVGGAQATTTSATAGDAKGDTTAKTTQSHKSHTKSTKSHAKSSKSHAKSDKSHKGSAEPAAKPVS